MTTQHLSPLTMLLSRHTRRREFISLVASSAVSWPIGARAQLGERVRRIGMLMALAQTDPEAQLRVGALEAGLRELGWIEGRNIHIDYHWAPGEANALRAQAAELIRSTPEVIIATARRSWPPYGRKGRHCRSCSSRLRIRSTAALSRTSLVPAAM